MLIGVDHGNKQIKTVHCEPFVSGLKQSVTRPFGQNVLRYQNTYLRCLLSGFLIGKIKRRMIASLS